VLDKNIVILHGWALKLNSGWKPFLKALRQGGYKVYLPLIPGLTGPKLKREWDLEVYSQWLKKFLKSKKINSFVLLGHSFGGSLCIKYAATNPPELKALVLINSSGIRRKSIKVRFLYGVSKTFKLLFLIYPLCLVRDFGRKAFYKLIGSTDYLQTEGYLTQTFRNIVNEDLTGEFENIKVPTLLLWGEDDKYTPIKEGRLMDKLIPQSELVIYPEGTHGLPFNQKQAIVDRIKLFICQLSVGKK
jgi:pimeloyl-ACP methyl ester carboxylesterase